MNVTRRDVLVALPAAGVVVVLAPLTGSPQSPGGLECGAVTAGASRAAGAPGVAGPVVSFHLDQPYLDLTGLEKPYVPPVGTRSGASLAALSEEQVLSRFYGSI